MTGAQAFPIADDDTPVPVYVPGGGDLGVLTQRVTTLEASDTAQEARLAALELATGDPAAVQEQIDESIAAHVNAVVPHPVYVLTHTHEQAVLSSVWVIVHNMPFQPAGIDVRDHLGNPHYPVPSWPSANTVQLTFNTDVRGTARLS